jgi:hypothetical protein
MPKKTFKNNTGHLDRFFTDPDDNGTQEPQQTRKIQSQPDKPKYYRINLKLKAEYKEYLDRVSWENKKSITQYLNDLIEADKISEDTKDI